jgi:hypothetical protein
MSLMHVGCELHYSVTEPTSFLFNVAVAHTAHQTVRHEVFTLTPHMSMSSTMWAVKETVCYACRPKPVH